MICLSKTGLSMQILILYAELRIMEVIVQLRRQLHRHGQHFIGKVPLLRDLVPAHISRLHTDGLLAVNVVPAPVVAVILNPPRVVMSVDY